MAPTHENLVHLDELPVQERAAGDIAVELVRLASAAGARMIGATRYVVAPSMRMMPAHVHSDEEEIFFVLAGDGLLWQDGCTYAVRAGDIIVHRIQEEAHTLIAGPGGLTVLAFGEGSLTNLTYLPRPQAWWLGTRWLPAEGPDPFALELALGPLELPAAPEDGRPPNVVNVKDVPPRRKQRRGYDITDRDLGRAAGSVRSGLRHDILAPGTRSCPPHWHTGEEELFYVLEGDGEAVLDDARLPIRPGSVLVRPPGSRVAHSLLAGEHGLTYLTYGTRVPSDICFYPRSGKVNIGRMTFRLSPTDYWEGEEDGA